MTVIASEKSKHFVVKIVGVGGANSQALESLMKDLTCGIDFIAAGDAQILVGSSAPVKIQIAVKTPDRNRAGSNSESNLVAAQESLQEIEEALKGSDIVFIVADGTENGAAQVFTDAAKGAGAKLTIGLVTLPFSKEGNTRLETAEEIRVPNNRVDVLIVIPNEAISSPVPDLFELTGNAILTEAVRGITDLVLTDGLMDFDLYDVKSVLPSGYPLAFGFGKASGIDRALKAAQKAMHQLSLGGTDIAHARGILVNITGSGDITSDDYNEINRFIHRKAKDDANIKIGVVRDDELEGEIKVTVYLSKFEPNAG